ncbi:MAG: glutamate-5-semialdehyde dehydrogenase [Chloroflexi bacterium]|nr:glutamate-5-semialdehyde dehydrogenase [Chloroflexota bacterium]
MLDIIQTCQEARKASAMLALSETRAKNTALSLLVEWLKENTEAIIRENDKDVVEARANGLSEALIDRLRLTPERLNGIAADVENVIVLADPVGEVFESGTLPKGLKTRKVRVPLGVIAVIYESRPNVTIDVASLALKSGNAVILRGGSETIHSNRILVEGIRVALQGVGIDPAAVQFIDNPSRELVSQLLKMHQYVDMLIPRGGAGLHTYCRENSTIPVITGGIGICHLFVDESADLDRSIEVIRNAKIQRPSVCNALDTVLVHESVSKDLVPRLISALREDGVSFRVEESLIQDLDIQADEIVQLAEPEDFDTEWLSLVLGIKQIKDLEEAIDHIAAHSTGHSDGILTGNEENASRFTHVVDSAVVYVNASTRFTDGAQLGLGAEVAVSTQPLHARGPMALRELTTFKWVVEGDYSVRE